MLRFIKIGGLKLNDDNYKTFDMIFYWTIFVLSSIGLICVIMRFLTRDNIVINMNGDTFLLIMFPVFLAEFILSIILLMADFEI